MAELTVAAAGVRAEVRGHPAAVAAVAGALSGADGRVWPGRRARLRRRDARELVVVALTGSPRAVMGAARVLGLFVVVAGMSHHVQDGAGDVGPCVIRVEVACYPPERVDPS